MKGTASRFFRWWRTLNDQGLVENTLEGYGKHNRAVAVGLLIAALPMLPLVVSDDMGLARGCLWYGWSAIAIAWALTIVGVMVYLTGKTALRYYRDWWKGR